MEKVFFILLLAAAVVWLLFGVIAPATDMQNNPGMILLVMVVLIGLIALCSR